MENFFEGYAQFLAPADDTELVKWRALQPTLRASLPIDPMLLDWQDIADFNSA